MQAVRSKMRGGVISAIANTKVTKAMAMPFSPGLTSPTNEYTYNHTCVPLIVFSIDKFISGYVYPEL